MSAGNEAALNVALIGVGRIGSMHAELVSRRVLGTRLAAVYDRRADVAEEVATRLGVPAAPSLEAVLADERIDAVGICASTDAHADLIVASAAAGKPIFVEKPISLDLAEVDRVLDAVGAAEVPLQVGLNRRFDPTHAAVCNAVASGAVGRPQLVRISSRDPIPPSLDYVRGSGGIFLDMTIHDFDMARYLADGEIVDVHARGALQIDPTFAAADDVDTAVLTLVHENGCMTVIDNSRKTAYGYDQRIEVFGSEGMAASENPLLDSSVVLNAEGVSRPRLADFFIDRYARSFEIEWEAFAAAVRAGSRPLVSGEDARAPLVAGLAAIRSLAEGRTVGVAEVEEVEAR